MHSQPRNQSDIKIFYQGVIGKIKWIDLLETSRVSINFQ